VSKLQTLIKQVENCRLCALCRGRHHAVPGEGNEAATVMLIGEGPGYHEDREGRPFIGPAGQFLDELLGLAGLRRADVYITNVVKCRPPNNRDPQPPEIEACAPYLDRQIATINPRVIVTLGRYSMAKFVNETSISRIHGKAWQQEGRLIVTMYHPAAGLHNQQLKDVIREDFRKLPLYIEQAQPARPAPAAAPLSAPEDAAALLDAYAALVAPPANGRPAALDAEVAVGASPAAEPEVGVSVAPESVSVITAPPDAAADALTATPTLATTGSAASEPVAAPVETSILVAAAGDAASRKPQAAMGKRRTRKVTTPEPTSEQPLVTAEPAASGAEPETVVPESTTLPEPVAAITEEAVPEAPSLPIATEGPIPADPAPAVPPARKKSKTAPPAEQLSLF
jgi:DNA polymerase